ncbi:MAG TPA: metallophosphoesterase [Pyrinomonadaceae bacterium]|nr:metallophosphoesterase [Pyrinomonadaceae bacterium]
MGRTVVVGDIHGCYDELQDLLGRVALAEGDRLVCVGDLVVKGEKNREVLDLFMSDARFSSVMGNHDRAVLRGLRGEPGLKATQERCVRELADGAERYAAFLGSLPLFVDLGSHVVVHAGLRPGVPLERQEEDDLVELRTLGPDRTSRDGLPWYEAYDGAQTVLFGHWPASPPRRGPRALGLDTGCVYGYQLTAYVLEEDRLVSVPARRAYNSPQGRAA